jgi:hypothetical protein
MRENVPESGFHIFLFSFNNMEQMMVCLLAEIRISREKMDANQTKTKADYSKTDASLREMR